MRANGGFTTFAASSLSRTATLTTSPAATCFGTRASAIDLPGVGLKVPLVFPPTPLEQPRMKKELGGVWPALLTPLTESGQPAHDQIEKLVELFGPNGLERIEALEAVRRSEQAKIIDGEAADG